MKKFFITLFLLLTISGVKMYAQSNRYDLGNGLTLVTYGSSAVIEDEKNQRSISIDIVREQQEAREHERNKVIYKVVCGKWTKRVVKDSLNAAIAAGIAAAKASGGTSLMVSAASKLANYIYDDICEYYEDEYGY